MNDVEIERMFSRTILVDDWQVRPWAQEFRARIVRLLYRSVDARAAHLYKASGTQLETLVRYLHRIGFPGPFPHDVPPPSPLPWPVHDPLPTSAPTRVTPRPLARRSHASPVPAAGPSGVPRSPSPAAAAPEAAEPLAPRTPTAPAAVLPSATASPEVRSPAVDKGKGKARAKSQPSKKKALFFPPEVVEGEENDVIRDPRVSARVVTPSLDLLIVPF